MIGPKTDNSIGTGDGNTQIGHNTGTIQIGLTFEQHEAALERAIARKEKDLERAHTAEKALIQRELDALRLRMLDLDADYKARLVELAETKALLQRYDNQIDRARYDEAIAALDRDETALAESILTDLAARASQRREDAARDEAKLVFKLGVIAEGRVDWASAAQHYARAADLAPDFDRLYKARALSFLVGDYQCAMHYGGELLRVTRDGNNRRQLTTALNEHAGSLRATGRYADAEPLFLEALEVGREILGSRHPDVASVLNNLAGLLEDTGRFSRAEPLYREALEISRETLGPRHPDVATTLNNLAKLLQARGRYAEAETHYREALKIGRETLSPHHPNLAANLNNLATLLEDTGRYAEAELNYGEALKITCQTLGQSHPDVAVRRNNIAGLYFATGRYDEAEPLFRAAMEIWRETLGPSHPNVAASLNNLAGLLSATGRTTEAGPMYLQALGIVRTSLGDAHPHTRTAAGNTLIHLRQHAPDHPDLPAAFPDL